MTRRSRFWRVAAGLFLFINVAGAAYAVVMGEPMHALIHAVLLTLALGAYSTWRVSRPVPAAHHSAQLSDDRLEYLQQSVDALALEVERIGEAQRFKEKLSAQGQTPPTKKDQ